MNQIECGTPVPNLTLNRLAIEIYLGKLLNLGSHPPQNDWWLLASLQSRWLSMFSTILNGSNGRCAPSQNFWIAAANCDGVSRCLACLTTNRARLPNTWSTSSCECPDRRWCKVAAAMMPDADMTAQLPHVALDNAHVKTQKHKKNFPRQNR